MNRIHFVCDQGGDDGSLKTGNAGARVGCAVVALSSGEDSV